MPNKIITIFGGSGFVGSYIVRELLKNGYVVNVFTRNADSASHLKPLANMGQINIVVGDIFNKSDVSNVITNSDVIINCVGTIIGGKKTIFNLNYEFPKLLSDVMNESWQSTKKSLFLIHFSAIINKGGTDNYTRSKLAGREVLQNKSNKYKVAILNPSVIFGEEDNFFNFFAKLCKISFFLPLINGGKSLVQPVYIMDVAKFLVKIIEEDKWGEFDLVGTKQYSIKEIFSFICNSIDKKRYFINLPNGISKCFAYLCEMPILYMVTKILTGKFQPLITRDQVALLSHDNISEKNSLIDLGITPQNIEDIVPAYLARYK